MNTKTDQITLACESKCPYCSSNDTDYFDTEFDAGRATQRARCYSCRKYWKEIYKLSKIMEIEV